MQIFTVDSSTDQPFCGNPAAVCVLDSEIDKGFCQLVAHEINYSETAFVIKTGDSYNIKWFTPKQEVDLCGHETLAAAKILFEINRHDFNIPIEFNSKSGKLIAKSVIMHEIKPKY